LNSARKNKNRGLSLFIQATTAIEKGVPENWNGVTKMDEK
jgi:hypothetical protein